ncbi:MBL fold metallo-hydrolase [Gemmatimonas phototrophica]|uniref:Zn-dependent hydrolase n=1 Tax=Gemmatimonas phototrophica TaxID=1379270 RepID=A0A143BLT9_9BACT|nr:MBL fold metallo-hydrolase [Gemmatimonas phototrophica]AMW05480.1 Zn-dependent hydrolase [Gemmatimonas phototrophica]
MFFRQLYDQALAQASYLIGCQATGEAIVIDPLRDPAPYLEVARAEGLRITHITETHIHADFVSGARELRAATGAQLFLSAEGGPDWQYAFAAADGATLLRDGDRIMVGNIRLDVMHTPGHTPEHLSFVVTDTPRGAGAMGVLTGDFVFVGDVGRPDLLEKAAKVANTMEAGAHTLFASVQRFRSLPDYLQVWPGHGAGSACGKALGAVPSSTVGYEKLANWGVGTTNEDDFVRMVLEGQPEPPRYFAEMKRINRDGAPVLGALAPLPRLSASAVRAQLGQPAVWHIDVRSAAAFAAQHLPGSLSVAYSKSFSTWVGSLVPYTADIVLLAPADGEALVERARHDLFHIGMDRVIGWAVVDDVLAEYVGHGGVPGQIKQRTAAELAALGEGQAVLDVRGRSEWAAGHIPHARHIPLGELPERLAELPAAPLVVQCQSGARSAIATSLLHRLGRRDAVNLQGGYAGWQANGLPTSLSSDLVNV